MDLEQRLRQLHKIEPNPVYARVSRARILTARPRVTWRSFVFGVMQSGSAIALTGLFLLLAGGAFSVWRLIEPVTGLNHRALTAEAEAIDIQIQLADLQYQDGANFGREGLTAAAHAPQPHAAASLKTAAVTAGEPLPATTPADASSTPTGTGSGNGAASDASSTPAAPAPATVDDVLNALSK